MASIQTYLADGPTRPYNFALYFLKSCPHSVLENLRMIDFPTVGYQIQS